MKLIFLTWLRKGLDKIVIREILIQFSRFLFILLLKVNNENCLQDNVNYTFLKRSTRILNTYPCVV